MKGLDALGDWLERRLNRPRWEPWSKQIAEGILGILTILIGLAVIVGITIAIGLLLRG